MSSKVLWDVVRTAAARTGIDKLAPHDLWRTCARLCHEARRRTAVIVITHIVPPPFERAIGLPQD